MSSELEILRAENKELKDDIKSIKSPLVDLCTILGFIDNEGNINENFRVSKLMSKLSMLLLNPGGIEKEFGFLKTLFPLFKKYKDI